MQSFDLKFTRIFNHELNPVCLRCREINDIHIKLIQFSPELFLISMCIVRLQKLHDIRYC